MLQNNASTVTRMLRNGDDLKEPGVFVAFQTEPSRRTGGSPARNETNQEGAGRMRSVTEMCPANSEAGAVSIAQSKATIRSFEVPRGLLRSPVVIPLQPQIICARSRAIAV